MNLLMHIADRALNCPLLITPEKAQVIISVLGNRIGVNVPSADRFEGASYEVEDGRVQNRRPYKTTPEGVAIISIVGSLVNRGAHVGASSGIVSYEGIKHQLKHAANNDQVRSVILDIQSPGGEAVGAFETADMVRSLASKKRTIAVVNGMAASAAYAIASAATEIVTTKTGISGSIGVVLVHADYSKMLDNEGISPTLIFAGSHKVDGNPFEPLTDAVQSGLQDEVNAFYQEFLITVAEGRGNRLTANDARATEAKIKMGQEAVDIGLADRVGTFETVLEELSRAQGGRSISPNRRNSMSEKKGTPAANEDAGFTQVDIDSARAEGRATGLKEGAATATSRLATILEADAISGSAARIKAAMSLAVKSSDMSADDIVAFISERVPEAENKSSPASLENRGDVPDSLAAISGGSDKRAQGGLSALVDAYVGASA